jgi:hypothetical protein
VTNDQPEFDRVIAALRSGANPAELAGEDVALEAMASTFASTPGTVRSLGSARSLRVVALVAASLIGMGGIAAAGAATLRPARDTREISTADTVVDTTTPDTVVDTTTPDTVVDTTVPVTTLSAVLAEALVDDPTTDFDETQCAEGNHGATVSSIAKETPAGPEHGDVVSEAAHSSCGKNADETTTDDTVVEPLVDDPATEFDETLCAEGNHGATVSSIAKATPPGPGHGDEVSIAAHSSCGKNTTTDDTTADTIADDGTDTTTVTATDDDSPGNSAGHGNSNGHGSGNGNSGGNGNGRGNGKPGG